MHTARHDYALIIHITLHYCSFRYPCVSLPTCANNWHKMFNCKCPPPTRKITSQGMNIWPFRRTCHNECGRQIGACQPASYGDSVTRRTDKARRGVREARTGLEMEFHTRPARNAALRYHIDCQLNSLVRWRRYLYFSSTAAYTLSFQPWRIFHADKFRSNKQLLQKLLQNFKVYGSFTPDLVRCVVARYSIRTAPDDNARSVNTPSWISVFD